MDVIERIKELAKKRGWSQYRLAHEADLSMSTISNIFSRGTTPNVATLEILCDAFGITLAQFFTYEEDYFSVNSQQRRMLEYFGKLSGAQQEKLLEFLDSLDDGTTKEG